MSHPVRDTHPRSVAPERADDAAEAPHDCSSGEELSYLSDLFQMLASPTRLRIVEALAERELCVNDIAVLVGVSQSAVSHQLRQMRQMRLVRYRKAGRLAFYRLDDRHVEMLFRIGLEHVREANGREPVR